MDKNKYIATFAGLIVVILFLVMLAGGISFDGEQRTATDGILSDLNLLDGVSVVTEDVVVGEGAEAVEGKVLTVHYTGELEDGTVFDSSKERGEPFTFTLGAGEVIEGWDRGFEGMRVGGQRMLVIPPELAYGAQELGPIPANSTLIFKVELLEVEDQ